MTFPKIFPVLVLLCAGIVSPASATDLASMSQADIRALQQRLTDAKCYSGPIDGTASASDDVTLIVALKACPVMDPILSIETGMHTATIKEIGVDRDCKLLATGSDDKTVRLWSLPDGRLLRTLRMPIGPGDNGKAFAVAVSPDGRLIAAGGWDAHSEVDDTAAVYLFDVVSGEMKARVGSFGGEVYGLKFSTDGRYLAVTLGGSNGLSVIDVAQSREIASDPSYGASSYQSAFTADGRLFTIAEDRYLRAYDSNFRLIKKVTVTGGRDPLDLAADPSGKLLAVGYGDSKKVEVYRTSDLGREYVANTSGLSGEGDLSRVAWSRDGRKLIAGGSFGNGGTPVVIWDRSKPGRAPV